MVRPGACMQHLSPNLAQTTGMWHDTGKATSRPTNTDSSSEIAKQTHPVQQPHVVHTRQVPLAKVWATAAELELAIGKGEGGRGAEKHPNITPQD